MTATIENGTLTIKIPVNNPPPPSKTGRSLVVATTSGNVVTDTKVQGKNLVIGLNAYIKAN